MAVEYDVLIRGAMLYDGTGAAPRRDDVALRGDRIARVGGLDDAHAPVAIDARGLALAPGFIDVHTHDDFALVVRPEMDFKILGGVTTVVVGNCGSARPFPMASHGAHVPSDATLPEWSGYGGYMAARARAASTNAAVLIGHGTARASVMGVDQRDPTAGELEAMKEIVREGRDAGAVGLSTGLVYEPGRYARTDELVALAAELAGSGALYATHMRNEGAKLCDSVREAIEIGLRAGVPVQISHHKAAGEDAWGLVRESLALIERAQADGMDVHADQYPYTAGSTSLAAIFQNGGFDERSGGMGSVAPELVVIASSPKQREWEGLSVAALARLGSPRATPSSTCSRPRRASRPSCTP
jgi:N-acyl-D-amino-acid deacylase